VRPAIDNGDLGFWEERRRASELAEGGKYESDPDEVVGRGGGLWLGILRISSSSVVEVYVNVGLVAETDVGEVTM